MFVFGGVIQLYLDLRRYVNISTVFLVLFFLLLNLNIHKFFYTQIRKEDPGMWMIFFLKFEFDDQTKRS